MKKNQGHTLSSIMSSSTVTGGSAATPVLEPWIGASVLIGTACGSMTIDLFTEDFPKACNWFVRLCKAQVIVGAMATAVRYGGSLLRFEIPLPPPSSSVSSPQTVGDGSHRRLFQPPWFGDATSTAGFEQECLSAHTHGIKVKKSSSESNTTSTTTTTTRRGCRFRFGNRAGLLLVPSSSALARAEDSECAKIHIGGPTPAVNHAEAPPRSEAVFFLTLTSQNFDFLEQAGFVAIGQIAEGIPTLSRMRGSCGGSSVNILTMPPRRLIRIKRCVLLASAVEDRNCNSMLSSLTDESCRRLNEWVGLRTMERNDPKWWIIARRRATTEAAAVVLRNGGNAFDFECNPHADHDGYLSSDDDQQQQPSSSGGDAETMRLANQRKVDETRALMMHVMDGITDTSIAPPENVLFVCKLNPLTRDEGLRTCFSQFGRVLQADVVRDAQGNSRCYAFVTFEDRAACDRAVEKMDRALIDDCRIHCDYSQSVSKVWLDSRKRPRDAQE